MNLVGSIEIIVSDTVTSPYIGHISDFVGGTLALLKQIGNCEELL